MSVAGVMAIFQDMGRMRGAWNSGGAWGNTLDRKCSYSVVRSHRSFYLRGVPTALDVTLPHDRHEPNPEQHEVHAGGLGCGHSRCNGE